MPKADAAEEMKTDRATVDRSGDVMESQKRTEYWDRIVDTNRREKLLKDSVNDFEKQKRKELHL